MAREISDKERERIPAEDFAGKGRSFPIQTPEDVHDAAASIGRAGDDNYSTDELKARIIRIAKRMGAEFVARLPEAWKDDDGGEKVTASEAPRVLLLIGAGKAGTDGLRRMPVSMIVSGYKGKQRFRVTVEDLAAAVRNFRKRKTGDLVIDYDHSTLSAGDGEPKPAAGWLKRIDDQPDTDGVLWGEAEFTERAARMLDAREYKYISPVTDWGVKDKTTGEAQGATITSIALTNSPLFEGLPALPLAASDTAGWKFDRGDVVDVKETKTVKITRVILAAAAAGKVRLVADDNTETEFAVEGLRVVSMADVKRGSDGRYDFSTLPHGEGVLVASDVLAAREAQEAIDAAVKEGKILPPQRAAYERLAASDPAGFGQLVASMKPQVDLKTKGTAAAEGESADGAQAIALTAAVKATITASDGKLDYRQALAAVERDNPDLVRAYMATVGGTK